MDIFIHIGTEKTGTTTIQKLLHERRDVLLEHGYYFLRSPGEENNRELVAYCMRPYCIDDFFRDRFITTPERREEFRRDFHRRFMEEIAAIPPHVHTVIASSEHFHSRLTADEEVECLRDLLRPIFSNVRILTYIRPQVDVALSLYSTALISGLSVEVADFVDQHCHAGSPYFNYLDYLTRWERFFSSNALTVRLFDRAEFLNGNLLDDFLAALSRELVGSIDTSITSKNEQISALGQSVLKVVNRQIPQFVEGVGLSSTNLDVVKTVSRTGTGTGVGISAERYFEIQSRFDDTNEAVRRDFFGDRPTLFGERKPRDYASGPSLEDEALLEAVVGVFSRAAMPSFYAEILDEAGREHTDTLARIAAELAKDDAQSAYDIMRVAQYIRPSDHFVSAKLMEYDHLRHEPPPSLKAKVASALAQIVPPILQPESIARHRRN
jgi:hypothetical protein